MQYGLSSNFVQVVMTLGTVSPGPYYSTLRLKCPRRHSTAHSTVSASNALPILSFPLKFRRVEKSPNTAINDYFDEYGEEQ